MRLRASFLASEAKSNVDGTFEVHAGGITDFTVTGGYILGAPMRLQFAVVVRLELDEEEVDTVRMAEVSIWFNGKQLANPMRLPMALKRVTGEKRYYLNLLVNSRVDVPGPGEGYVAVSIDHGRLLVPQMHFRVKL
jgi:hypothetical protein